MGTSKYAFVTGDFSMVLEYKRNGSYAEVGLSCTAIPCRVFIYNIAKHNHSRAAYALFVIGRSSQVYSLCRLNVTRCCAVCADIYVVL